MARRRITRSEQRGPLLHQWIATRRPIADRLVLGPTLWRALVSSEVSAPGDRPPLDIPIRSWQAVPDESVSFDAATTLAQGDEAIPSQAARGPGSEALGVPADPIHGRPEPGLQEKPPAPAVGPLEVVDEMAANTVASSPFPLEGAPVQTPSIEEETAPAAAAQREQTRTDQPSLRQPDIHAGRQPVEIDPSRQAAAGPSFEPQSSPIEPSSPADTEMVEQIEIVPGQPSSVDEPSTDDVVRAEPAVTTSASETVRSDRSEAADTQTARLPERRATRGRIVEIPAPTSPVDSPGVSADDKLAAQAAVESTHPVVAAPDEEVPQVDAAVDGEIPQADAPGGVAGVVQAAAEDASIPGSDVGATVRVAERMDAAADERTTSPSPQVDLPPEPETSSGSRAMPRDEWIERRGPRPSRGPEPTPPPRAADALFQESPGDRSPNSWVSRLVEVVRQEREAEARRREPSTDERPAASASPRPRDEPASPPSEMTRRFLTPRVGIDPADVAIRRGAAATQRAASYQADALAQGDEVVIAAGFPEDTPEGLGLLAHELTHVARNRQSRFLPPIVARDRGVEQVARSTSAATSGEEGIATSVEQAVRSEARAVRYVPPIRAGQPAFDPGWNAPDREAPGISPAQPLDVEPLPGATTSVETAPTQQVARDLPLHEVDWGGLPSPWEPMPVWTSPIPNSEAGEALTPGRFGATSNGAYAASGQIAPGEAAAPPMTAATNRSMDLSGSSVADSMGEAQPSTVEPDLDALARQVYDVLKRRLAVERRRIG